ncbi:MAG: hypothetical protein JW768_13515 [Chitinispirillaceae bacterium]|nr:hypothetical protein [Chitinispirillaceae bacterium]
MKTAISIPDRLFRSSERAAKKMGISRSRFFSNAVSHYLHDISHSDVTERLNQVYGGLEQSEAGVSDTLVTLQMNTLRKGVW